MKQTIIIDFDGVLHSYTSGWQGAHIVGDLPTPGAKGAMRALREKYKVVVVSSRCHQLGGKKAVEEWLSLHEIDVDEVTSEKPPHIVVVDDRALRFEGDWNAVIEGIPTASVPWNKKDNQP
jgi:hypothetical protein